MSGIRRSQWQGSHWIRETSRLCLYIQSGWRCVYCGRSPRDEGSPDDLVLTLDHLSPDGGNGRNNLVVACARCNESKSDSSLDSWCAWCDKTRALPAGTVRAIVEMERFKPITAEVRLLAREIVRKQPGWWKRAKKRASTVIYPSLYRHSSEMEVPF